MLKKNNIRFLTKGFSKKLGLFLMLPILGACYFPFHSILRNSNLTSSVCSIPSFAESEVKCEMPQDNACDDVQGESAKVEMACCHSKKAKEPCCCSAPSEQFNSEAHTNTNNDHLTPKTHSISASPCLPTEFFRAGHILLFPSIRDGAIVLYFPEQPSAKPWLETPPQPIILSQAHEKTSLPFYIRFQSFRC